MTSSRGGWKGETLNGRRQEAARGSAGWRHGVLLPQLQLAGQTHRAGEGLRVVDLDVEAERRLKAPGEELDTLFLVEAASPGEERLEAVLVVRDGAGALA